jgi:AraC-like DNA-binding protein
MQGGPNHQKHSSFRWPQRRSFGARVGSVQPHPGSPSSSEIRVVQKTARARKRGLVLWQKRRRSELLHEKIHGRIRLSELARECGLSVSHFARSFKISFGISTHQWLIRHRIDTFASNSAVNRIAAHNSPANEFGASSQLRPDLRNRLTMRNLPISELRIC